jgi:NADPH-dependent glutamate synthase beta subunit-like oxidoreductase
LHLFDAHAEPGGMLRYGIPEYRLPKQALAAEVESIRRLGARFQMNARWSEHFTLSELRMEYDAVFLAIGAQRAQKLRCEGEENALAGTEFLELVARGNPPSLGGDVIVVGGGNTAMDCARSARRLGAQRVRVLYRRSREEMPCLLEEVEDAEAEGIQIDLLVAPVRLERSHHGLLLTCRKMALGEADVSGRRRPLAIEGSDFTIKCSTVIAAIGQTVERALAEREGLQVTAWGIASDERTLATNLPGVFAGGDAVLGADLAVRAVAAGRMAAVSIHQYLRGEAVTGEPAMAGIALRPIDDDERAAIFRAIEKAARVPSPHIPIERRQRSFDEVDQGLSDSDATREAHRCLTCGCRKAECCTLRSLATEYEVDIERFAGERRRFAQDASHTAVIYEPGKCVNCDACVRIAAKAGETPGLAMIGRGFDVRIGVPFGGNLADALREETAVHCAEACPSGALSLRGACGCSDRPMRSIAQA